MFHGSGYSQLVRLFKDHFAVVQPRKPKASRDRSAETYLLGRRLKSAGKDASRGQNHVCAVIPAASAAIVAETGC